MNDQEFALAEDLRKLLQSLITSQDLEAIESTPHLMEAFQALCNLQGAKPTDGVSLQGVDELLKIKRKTTELPLTGQDFIETLVKSKDILTWYPNSVFEDQDLAEITQNYCCNLVGKQGNAQSNPFALINDNILCGLFYLGPNQHYPEHKHPAVELYYILSGTAGWKRAGEDWTDRSPGDYFHHKSNQSHAMRSYDEPLLALWIWTGNLEEWASWSKPDTDRIDQFEIRLSPDQQGMPNNNVF